MGTCDPSSLFASAHRVGVDAGTLFLKIAFLDERGEVIGTCYLPHHGEPWACLERMGAGASPGKVVVTGSSLESSDRPCVDLVQATIRGVRRLRPEARNIIDIGANSARLIELDGEGRFRSLSQNTLCAAGTGSFLDEELARLRLSYDDLPRMEPVDDPPSIASRCAVFAKTDVIHRQQEGHSKAAILDGLCRSMLRTCLDALLKGKALRGPTVLVGGVSLNPKVVRWLGRDHPFAIEALQLGPVVGAIGAALSETPARPRSSGPAGESLATVRNKPLKLEKSKFPSFDAHRVSRHDGTEVREQVALDAGPLAVFLGIDIGSTSTKAAVVDRAGRLILDLYRRTHGEPVQAARKILEALRRVAGERGISLEILGVGTTGSGRKLVGSFLGADLVVNEITAHAAGAAAHRRDVRTVFEIGGQDAKYLRLRDGRVVDSNMNYVCAAGTGSFVEEQARKLGYSVEEVGDVVLGLAPPVTSDRCTIFMEQDTRKLLRQGATREEALAATVYSVIRNYLSKVVGNRKVEGGQVMFVGATARNKGLVAAIEQSLGVEVIVPPFCHVMGAFGVCVKLAEAMHGRGASKFRGFGVIDEEVALEEKDCALCTNYCRVTELKAAGLEHRVSWGYMCGRDPEEKRKRDIAGMELFAERDRILASFRRAPQPGRPTLGLPMALAAFQFLPLWSAFFDRLGFNLVTSRRSTPEVRAAGVNLAGGDFCYPAKVGLGHVAALLDDPRVDRVFLPSMIEGWQNEQTSRSFLCPMVINAPYYGKAAVDDHPKAGRILSAPVNLNWPDARQLDFLSDHLAKELGLSRARIEDAWNEARSEQRRFNARCQQAGRDFLARDTGERSRIVLLGRPYLLYDYDLGLRLPQTIASYGHTVIPVDLMPFDDQTREEIRENHDNMYWHNGQVILNAVEQVRARPDMHAILLTSFNCGPDSFLSGYVESAMGEKPLLTLELDEHASAGGYLTRLEAFFDNVLSSPVKSAPRFSAPIDFRTIDQIGKEEEVVIQFNPDPLPSVYAAALRGRGIRTKLLPPSSAETYALGLQHMKGTECCPAISSGGTILEEALRRDGQPFNVVYANTCGPCRLGQYTYKYNSLLKSCRRGENRFVTFKLHVDQVDSFGVDFKLGVFRGVAGIDILGKLVQRTRPYERNRGETDAVYGRFRQEILGAVEKGASIDDILRRAGEAFRAIPADRGQRRPLVGIVGEFFVRADSFMNQDLVRTIEEHGGEAWLVDTTEWQIWGTSRSLPEFGEYGEGLTDTDGELPPAAVLARLESEQDRLIDLCGELLADRHEPHMRDVYAAAAKYVDVTCPNEVLPVVGRGILFATRDRASVVVNTKPFSCLPGNMAGAILNRVRNELGFAYLDLAYEGSGDPNAPLRTMLANLRAL